MTEKDKTEVIQGHSGKFIYGINQHPNHIPDADKLCSVNECGDLFPKKMPTDEQLICNFWSKQQNKLALLLIISAGIPFSILVQETDLFDLVFGTIFDLIFVAFLHF